MGITVEQFVQRYPVAFHMAARDSWPSIQKHGLLSTSALLNLFEVTGDDRIRIEETRRPESVQITHPVHGCAVIRDQKPLTDGGLAASLRDGISLVQWYRRLNERVFFWVSRERLLGLLNAHAYRDTAHLVLEVDTYELLHRHSESVQLSAMNSGSSQRSHPRGRDTFLPLNAFPYEERRQRRLEPVVELCVVGAVTDVVSITRRVVEMRGQAEVRTIWTPEARDS